MKNLIKTTIVNGNYKLQDIQKKLKRLFWDGDLSETEYTELMEQARQHSTAEAEKPEIKAMLQTLIAKVDDMEKRLEALEGNSGENSPAVPGDYPTWKPYDGITKDYVYGAIVWDEGVLWKSTFEGQNVWKPGVYGWVRYTVEE